MIYNLSARLKQLRQEKHLKQEQVALLVGVTKSAVSSWELDMRQPSYAALIRLADLYRVSTDYLLGREDQRSVDLSGLTAAEATLICDLVASMTAKNKRMPSRLQLWQAKHYPLCDGVLIIFDKQKER